MTLLHWSVRPLYSPCSYREYHENVQGNCLSNFDRHVRRKGLKMPHNTQVWYEHRIAINANQVCAKPQRYCGRRPPTPVWVDNKLTPTIFKPAEDNVMEAQETNIVVQPLDESTMHRIKTLNAQHRPFYCHLSCINV